MPLRRIATAALPAVTILCMAILASMPWGAPLPVRFALPLLTLGCIDFWVLRRPRLVPSPVVFAAGLVTDLTTSGPLGYWTLMYLLGLAACIHGPRLLTERLEGPLQMVQLIALVALVSFVGWLVTMVYFLRPMPMRPALLGGIVACGLYPVLAFLLAPLETLIGRGEPVLSLIGEER